MNPRAVAKDAAARLELAAAELDAQARELRRVAEALRLAHELGRHARVIRVDELAEERG